MPLPKPRELREKTDKELNKMLDDYQLELIKLGDTSPGRRRALKKVIARIKTILNERRGEGH